MKTAVKILSQFYAFYCENPISLTKENFPQSKVIDKRDCFYVPQIPPIVEWKKGENLFSPSIEERLPVGS